jgi:hypothetical protein
MSDNHNNHGQEIHNWDFSCCMCCKNNPNDFKIMWYASVFKAYYYLTEEQAIAMARTSNMTDYQISELNIRLLSRGCADVKFST